MTEEEKPESDAPTSDQPRGESAGEDSSETKSSEAAEKKVAVEPAEAPKPDYKFLGIVSAIMLAADLVTKEWAANRLADPKAEPIKVIEGINLGSTKYALHFDLAKNKGGAWGVLGEQPDYVRLPFFFIISALAVVFIVGLYRKLEPRQWALKWALPLVLAGALGNLVDRIRHQHVIDFIDAFFVKNNKASHWPTFNVADIWIVAGVILMAIDWFTPAKKPTRGRSPVSAPARD